MLVSDYEGWHYILNNWYLHLTDAEFEEHHEKSTHAEIEATWQRIFGPFPVWAEYPDTVLQATIDHVYTHEVTHVRPIAPRRSQYESVASK